MPRNPQLGRMASTYIEETISTESPLGLVARIFEMASLEIARARASLAASDPVGKGMAVHQASRCLSLLQCNLRMDEGGEVARNLDRLYTYLLNRLTLAHLNNDDSIFAEIGGHLSEMGGAWRQAANQQRQEEAPGAPQPEPALAATT